MSAWIWASENLRPIMRLASKTVLMGFIAVCEEVGKKRRR